MQKLKIFWGKTSKSCWYKRIKKHRQFFQQQLHAGIIEANKDYPHAHGFLLMVCIVLNKRAANGVGTYYIPSFDQISMPHCAVEQFHQKMFRFQATFWLENSHIVYMNPSIS